MEHGLKFLLGLNLVLMIMNAFINLISIVTLCKFIGV